MVALWRDEREANETGREDRTMTMQASNAPSMSTDAAPVLPITTPQVGFNRRNVWMITVAHFLHDMYPAFLAPLIPLLTDKFALTLFIAGFLQPVQRLLTLSQPFIGYYADRTSLRLFLVFAPLTTAIVTSLLGIAPNPAVIFLLLLLSGLSSAMFHAPGIAAVTASSGTRWGMGMSIFMAGGDIGRSIGPIVVVVVVQHFALRGLALAFVPAAAISIATFFGLGAIRTAPVQRTRRDLFGALRTQRGPLRRLLSVITVRGLVLNSFVIFLAEYAKMRGDELIYAGIAVSVFYTAGVIGGFIGGTLSDRVGRKPIIVLSLLMPAAPLFLFTQLRGIPSLIALFVGGLFLLCASAVTLTVIQEILPHDRATGAGLAITAEYTVSALGTILCGLIADRIGLPAVIQMLTLIPIVGIPLALMLPETRKRAQAVAASS